MMINIVVKKNKLINNRDREKTRRDRKQEMGAK